MKLTIHPKEQKGSVPAHRLEALDLWMSQLVEKKVLPFAMTILQQGEQLLYWRWCGQSQPVSGQPIHAETPLRVYSMTKPVTVLSALILEEQGLLDLEVPVENWIPELAGARTFTQPNSPLEDCIELTHGPSLKQLMTHTSGYSYNSPSGSFLDQALHRKLGGKPNLNLLLSTLEELPLAFNPGTAWRYGLGIDVLGMVLMRVSGKDLGTLMKEQIFDPLGMNDTGFFLPEAEIPNLADLHHVGKEGGYEKIEDPFPDPASARNLNLGDGFPNHWGGAGLFSTAADWLKFSNMLRKAVKGKENPVANPELIRKMATNQLAGDIASLLLEGPERFREWMPFEGLGMGLGVWVAQDSSQLAWNSNPGEFGWGGVANTVFWIDPVSDSSVLFFTQVMPSSQLGLRMALHRFAAEILHR